MFDQQKCTRRSDGPGSNGIGCDVSTCGFKSLMDFHIWPVPTRLLCRWGPRKAALGPKLSKIRWF